MFDNMHRLEGRMGDLPYMSSSVKARPSTHKRIRKNIRGPPFRRIRALLETEHLPAAPLPFVLASSPERRIRA